MVSGNNTYPTIILLHGFAQHPDSWDEAAALLREAGFPTIAVDLMALTKEADGQKTNACGFDAVCRAVSRVVRDEHEESGVRPVLVGYSMGGRIALETVLRASRAGATLPLSALVLESAHPGPANQAEAELFRKRNHEWAQRVRSLGAPAFMDWWATLPLFASQRRLPQGVRDRLREGRCDNAEEDLAFQLEAWGQHNQSFRLDSVAYLARAAQFQPTAYFVGALDEKYCAIACDLESTARAVSVRIFPGAGHNIHLEVPEAYTDTLLSLLN